MNLRLCNNLLIRSKLYGAIRSSNVCIHENIFIGVFVSDKDFHSILGISVRVRL